MDQFLPPSTPSGTLVELAHAMKKRIEVEAEYLVFNGVPRDQVFAHLGHRLDLKTHHSAKQIAEARKQFPFVRHSHLPLILSLQREFAEGLASKGGLESTICRLHSRLQQAKLKDNHNVDGEQKRKPSSSSQQSQTAETPGVTTRRRKQLSLAEPASKKKKGDDDANSKR